SHCRAVFFPFLHSLRSATPPRPTCFPYTTLFRSAGRRPNRKRSPRPAIRCATAPWPSCASRSCPPPCWSSSPPWAWRVSPSTSRSEEHTSELQSREKLVCRLLLEKKKKYYMEDEE